MSLVRSMMAALVVVALTAAPARAQTVPTDRFFADSPEDEESRQSTTYDGSFTSTTFYYREDGSAAPPPSSTGPAPFSASPVDRIFTDLRTQLDARHMGGSKADVRADLRGRLNTTTYSTGSNPADQDTETEVPYQSGTFSGNELDVRELYVRRNGSTFDVGVGRQYSLELAATRFDGLKLEGQGERWKFILFGGLYPSRISRDLREDYPRGVVDDPTTAGLQPGARVFPVVGGVGTAYRSTSAHGALGVVGILPLAEDQATGAAEDPRVFATSSGYWRASSTVDVHHYVVADATGADGAGLTNFTLGVNLQPTKSLRAYASVNRIDTETLNVVAQTKLQEPDSEDGGAVQPTLQNNLEVQRIAQESARVGLSANFGERVEISTSGAVRRRGELRFEPLNGDPDDPADDVVFAAAQAADVTLALVDRKSIGDTRLGLSATRSFGVGNASLYRNKATLARLEAIKELAEGRAELEGSLTYISSADDNRGSACSLAMAVETCYGAAEVQSFTFGGLLFYRVSPDWFMITNANLGAQMSKAASSAGALTDQPTILTTALLLRLAYRF